jgi:hypothetical protein
MSEPRHAPPTMAHAAPLVVVVPANVSGDDPPGSALVPCTEDSGSVEVTVGSGLVATIGRDPTIDRNPECAVALLVVAVGRGDPEPAGNSLPPSLQLDRTCSGSGNRAERVLSHSAPSDRPGPVPPK